MKQHVRCVLCFVCLISFYLFNSIHSAIAQGSTLAPSKRVVINLGAHTGAPVCDALVPVDFTMRKIAVRPSCQEPIPHNLGL